MDKTHSGPERGRDHISITPEAAATEGVRGRSPARGRFTDSSPPPKEKRVEVHYEGDQWVLDHDGHQEVKRAHGAREKAVARARSLAQERKALLVIYDEEGTIEEQQDYGTMGVRPNPESDVTGPGGTAATAKAEERTMHRG